MDLDSVTRLKRDLAASASTLGDDEARFLVDSYYQMQGNRIRSDNQIRSIEGEPHHVLSWLSTNASILEDQIKRALDAYTEARPIGQWLRGIYGIGPVISAGLIAHIDINKAPTAGHIWRYAGFDPTSKWEKGKKRPWNASLKVVCYKAGESFVKFHNSEKCFYGHLYKARKAEYEARNEAGGFSERAAEILGSKNFNKSTEAYKAYSTGRLPPAHIHAMARRYAIKIFLSHLHDRWFRLEFDKAPPAPFAIAHLGHAHLIEPTTSREP